MGNGGRVDVRLAWLSGLAGYGLRRHGWLRPAVSVGLHVCVGAVWTTGRASPSWLDWVEGRLCFYGWPSVRAWGECYALTRTYEISGDNEVEQQAMFGEKHMLSSIEEFPADLASGPGPVPAEPVLCFGLDDRGPSGLRESLGHGLSAGEALFLASRLSQGRSILSDLCIIPAAPCPRAPRAS